MNQIDALRHLLAAQPRPVGWAERRQRIEEVAGIDPAPSDITFTPQTIDGLPCEWSATPDSDPGRVILFLHGGGYCSGSIRSHRTMASGIARAAGVRTLAVGYRLAPEHPFPAALNDALTAYRFLRDQGIPAHRIAIGGDSAGGGLSLACLLHLRDTGEPLPGCAWLVSPWTDLAMTGASLAQKDAVDPLIHAGYLNELAAAYLAGHDPHDPLVSPLYAPLNDLPPVLIQVGSAETLLDDATRMTRALGEADVAVRLEIWPQMIHAWPLWSARLADGQRALDQAGAFIRQHLADPVEEWDGTSGKAG